MMEPRTRLDTMVTSIQAEWLLGFMCIVERAGVACFYTAGYAPPRIYSCFACRACYGPCGCSETMNLDMFLLHNAGLQDTVQEELVISKE